MMFKYTKNLFYKFQIINIYIYYMNIKFIICIILGIILYIIINKIEGLNCRGPLDNVLGEPLIEEGHFPQTDIKNKGSLPFHPKNNVMVVSRIDGENYYISENSLNQNPYDDNTTLTLRCNRLKDEERNKLAPYTALTIEGNTLTCHNPSKKVIFYNMHGSIKAREVVRPMFGETKSDFTQIPKKMQLIFYINQGNCYVEGFTNGISNVQIMFSSIYSGDDVVGLLKQPQSGEENLFNKGFSELETINGICMLIIDSNNVLVDFVSEIQEVIQYRYGDPYNPEIKNFYQVDCSKAFYDSKDKPDIYTTLFLLQHRNILYVIGPYCGIFPIIDFSSNDNNKLDQIIDRYPLLTDTSNYVTVTKYSSSDTEDEEIEDRVIVTYTYDLVNMENLKNLIRELIISQSVRVRKNYLSENFKSDEHRLNRLFNGNEGIELPIFCLSILSHPYFVNPFNDPDRSQYALPGGRYMYQDLIDLIFDIIGQITSGDYSIDETAENYSEVRSVYYRKMRSLGMSDADIDTFLSQCNFLYTQTIIPCNIPENFPLLPFMNLWEPWGIYTPETGSDTQYVVYEWSMETFLLLIQLFKQGEGEAIDVHSFTCLSGIGDERTTNNYRMDYSWQYAYSDEEANNPDKRIGPECQRPVCPQSEGEINGRLNASGKSPFIVDGESFIRENRHPRSREITYTKNDDGNITINRGYIDPIGITVKCSNREDIREQLICKYDEDAEEPLNYDESIRQLDPSRCLDASQIQVISGQQAYNLAEGGVGVYQDPNNLDQTIYIGGLTEQTACGVKFRF